MTLVSFVFEKGFPVKNGKTEFYLLVGNKNAERWDAFLAPCAAHRWIGSLLFARAGNALTLAGLFDVVFH